MTLGMGAPFIVAAMAGGMAGGMVGADMSGSSILMGAFFGGFMGAMGGMFGPLLANTFGQIGSTMIIAAGGSAMGTAMSGGNLLENMAIGAITAGVYAAAFYSIKNEAARASQSFKERLDRYGYEVLGNDEITGNSKIRTSMDQAWQDSHANINNTKDEAIANNTKEQGGWIKKDGEVIRWPDGIYNRSNPSPMPTEGLAASFHAHPNLGSSWITDPSPPDLVFVDATKVPGYVINKYGIIRIDPSHGRWGYADLYYLP